MQPVTTPEGVTFIRDDFKAPLWTVDASFEFMKAARAKRKIIVIGDALGRRLRHRRGRNTREVARRAQEIADVTVFVGPWASERAQGAQARTRRLVARVQPRPRCRRRTSTRSRARAIWSCSRAPTSRITCFASSWRAPATSRAGATTATDTSFATNAAIETSPRPPAGWDAQAHPAPIARDRVTVVRTGRSGARRTGDRRAWQPRTEAMRARRTTSATRSWTGLAATLGLAWDDTPRGLDRPRIDRTSEASVCSRSRRR